LEQKEIKDCFNQLGTVVRAIVILLMGGWFEDGWLIKIQLHNKGGT
jgi:hypothetical protein